MKATSTIPPTHRARSWRAAWASAPSGGTAAAPPPPCRSTERMAVRQAWSCPSVSRGRASVCAGAGGAAAEASSGAGGEEEEGAGIFLSPSSSTAIADPSSPSFSCLGTGAGGEGCAIRSRRRKAAAAQGAHAFFSCPRSCPLDSSTPPLVLEGEEETRPCCVKAARRVSGREAAEAPSCWWSFIRSMWWSVSQPVDG